LQLARNVPKQMSATRLSLEADAPPLLGRQSELVRLNEAIRKRESLLVWGIPDSGKSALVAGAIRQMPESFMRRCICASGKGSPQDILREIAQGFGDDPLFRSKFRADARSGASFSAWVKQQTSLRLRGLLYRAAGAAHYWIFLEDLAPVTRVLAHIVNELMWNQKTPVYAIAGGGTFNEIGYAARIYWNDRQKLHVGGLPVAAAKELLELSIRRYRLARLDLQGFRKDILEFSGMLPGAIIRMCAAAADSHYHFEGRIKTKLLHVDYLMNHCQPMLQTESHPRGGTKNC